MGRPQKLYINYGELTKKNIEGAINADDIDLMLLGAIMLVSDADGYVDISAVEQIERFDKTEITASLKFWRGAGIISATKQTTANVEENEERASAATTVKRTVIAHTSVEDYTNEELTNVIENRVGADFIDEAQNVMGKMFNKAEISKLVGIVDQLGFEQEAVLAILAYVVRIGKKSVSYAEKIAISFHDEDIFTAQAVHAEIDRLEKRNTAIEKIKKLYGFGGRALSTSEKKIFASWTEEYGFDLEIITKAYEITVDNKFEAIPKYTDRILRTWYENGLKTIPEIDVFLEAEKKKRAENSHKNQSRGSSRSYVPAVVASSEEKNLEIEEWFEAKLNKHFGN
ncbi:MAG: DnaD domain protein [Clostridia bacterium]|nr:DnaD domain protein [Clostridia bacterium]